MNPLEKVSQSFDNGIMPETVYDLIQKRFHLVTDGIKRIEKASSIKYPIAYVDPSIIVSGSSNSLDVGILYARTIPLIVSNSIQVVIQISAPLVAYGLKGTIHADNADVWGNVDGDLKISGTLTIQEQGSVSGSVEYQSLQIKLGGKIKGEIKNSEKVKKISEAQKFETSSLQDSTKENKS